MHAMKEDVEEFLKNGMTCERAKGEGGTRDIESEERHKESN
jgi:hypothetical protein